MMRQRGGSGGGGEAAGQYAVVAGMKGEEREYYRAKITTRKGQDPHNLDGLLDSLVGVIIQ